MKHSQKRALFTRNLARLLLYAEGLGFYPVIDQARRCDDCPIGHPNSTHKAGLAADILLYDRDFNWLPDPENYVLLHDFWDTLGGAERIANDMNHFSIEHNGVR